MPIRTRTPIGGKYSIDSSGVIEGDGEVLAPISLSDLFEIYGNPGLTGQLTHYSKWEIDDDGNLIHYSTFVADKPSEQTAVDIWAAQIDVDDEDVIRNKVNTAATADAARVDRDSGERKIMPMPALIKRKIIQ